VAAAELLFLSRLRFEEGNRGPQPACFGGRRRLFMIQGWQRRVWLVDPSTHGSVAVVGFKRVVVDCVWSLLEARFKASHAHCGMPFVCRQRTGPN
jgi:hypothetical protein